MGLRIYHNPRCSKSRKTLEIIQNAGVTPEVVLYLQDTPDAAEILAVADQLGKPLADLLRRGESVFKEAHDLPALDDEKSLAAWVMAHPIVLERPIVVDTDSGRAVMGRPPENVEELLG
jgi:arsenate reductase